MALEDAIYERLTTHTGTRALIERRVYPMVKPQSQTQACVVFQQITGSRVEVGGSDSGLTFPIYQFRCIARTYPAVKELAVQVVSALSRWSGTVAGETIQGTFDISKRDGEPEPGNDGLVSLYEVLVDARIWHAE